MSISVLCHGCGGRVEVADDDPRGRVRCPQCGVMCDLPAGPRKPAPARGAARTVATITEDTAVAEMLLSDKPQPAKTRKGTPREEIQDRPRPRVGAAPPPPPYPTEFSSEDDGKPYYVRGLDEERPCPSCYTRIPRDATFCTRCGYNLQTGEKVVQVYEEVDREWQGGWPPALRMGLFAGCQAVILPLMVWGAVTEGHLFGWFFPWLFFTAMTAFLIGTYDRIRLTRNKKGRVRLIKQSSVCFLPRPPVEMDAKNFSGVVFGKKHEVGMLEVFILLMLLVCGVIPGLVWLYLTFIRETFYVAMTSDHGYAAFILYQGGDEDLMHDIAHTVRNVAHLPCEQV